MERIKYYLDQFIYKKLHSAFVAITYKVLRKLNKKHRSIGVIPHLTFPKDYTPPEEYVNIIVQCHCATTKKRKIEDSIEEN
ncbi:unnamed protein product [Rhizophagus irregularis]|uniref:Uncharacterized protein n=1 Tax=Rhizophagus irregularis TaxID=588596 RepID=A0A915Z3Y0_9GLOM|nr:unnamed protein product [Rhizophagus irregularis]